MPETESIIVGCGFNPETQKRPNTIPWLTGPPTVKGWYWLEGTVSLPERFVLVARELGFVSFTKQNDVRTAWVEFASGNWHGDIRLEQLDGRIAGPLPEAVK